ncbi:hypothetical protein [Streptomyces vinaceus]|uniref:hypothetical protein n=1 Tax=Streptomyces vinaceus TaxID=1960 RepID=UPI0037F5CFAB
MLGSLVETSLRKVAGLGPRGPKAADAGVTALSLIDSEAALAELARLATQGAGRRPGGAGRRPGPRPGGDRGARGGGVRAHRRRPGRAGAGRDTALVEVRGPRAVLSWRTAAGKAVKSVPAAGRRR